jgi:catechol-2,3-dioxygenase
MVIVLTTGTGAGSPAGREAGLGPSGSLDHLAFAVTDGAALAAWADHLTESDVVHPGVVLENGNPTLHLRDPDGIAIELAAPGQTRA